jgi:t-SNARE complex subunit (syntaxin)
MQSAAVKMFRKIEKEEKQGPLKGPANELKHRSNLADARSKVQCLHDSVNMNAEQIAESIRDIEKCIEYAKQARLKDNSGSCGVILCFCFFVVCVVFIWIIAPKTRK